MTLDLLDGPFDTCEFPSPVEVRLFDVDLPCGFPSPARDYEEKSLDLNTYLVRNWAATFYFNVRGWSMLGAGIHDGDQVAVDRSITARHDHIVVAVVNQEYTVKRLYRRDGVVELRPEHPDFEPIRFSGDDELIVWGVVTGIVRRLRV